MDKLVKGENEMWKIPAKKRIQTRIVSASAVKRELDLLSVCPPTHLKMFRQNRNTHNLLRSNHPYYRNVVKHLWEKPQIIKFENSFHIWIDTGYICERTLSAMVRVLQIAIYNLNFNVMLLSSSRISNKLVLLQAKGLGVNYEIMSLLNQQQSPFGSISWQH